MRWSGLHGYGSPRSRGLSFGSAGRTVNVWRIFTNPRYRLRQPLSSAIIRQPPCSIGRKASSPATVLSSL